MKELTTADHLDLYAALASAAQPNDVYLAVQRVLAERLGFGLFTLLVCTDDVTQVRRVHTSNSQAYPVAGLKQMGTTPWGDRVLKNQLCYLTGDAKGILWAFPDHALIASLGLASAINVPLVAMGKVLGTINVLDAAGRYGEVDVDVVRCIAPYLVAPFLRDIG